jgi:hypothetical protein
MGSIVMNENKSTRYTEFIVDTINDLSNLEAVPRCAAYCIADGKIYIKKNDGTWKEM